MRKISNIWTKLAALKRLLLAFFKPDLRYAVNQLFAIRNLFFSRNKETSSINYPYELIDPYLVFGEDMVKCAFSLVGQNWLDMKSNRPVALLLGFNQWKWGFVKDYLPEYRSAFAPRKISWLRAFRAFFKLPIRPNVFVIWSYTEPKWITILAWIYKIKIYRMEDGFIRSSMLGATHATPYSLVLDSRGLYYNSNRPSDIENILNSADFSDSDLTAASECLDILKNLELSKYNPPPPLSSESLGIKTKRRIAVLGQVDNDMSIRLGNPQRWSMLELIKLAKLEHPDAEILYRPHPEVYLGYQKSRFKSEKVSKFCTIISPEGSLITFLETIDHVYTITSLSGLEALLRGIVVTVMGTPFYAGWGLTDDRVELPRRNTKLSLQQLFVGIYLKYPRYLADLANPEIGFKVVALRIAADRHINSYLAAKEIAKDVDGKKESLQQIAKSPYWPQLLFTKPGPVSEEIESIIPLMDVRCFLNNVPGKLFQRTLLLAVCGKIKNKNIRNLFLTKVRHYIDIEIYNDVLLLLNQYVSGLYIYEQLSWLLGEADEHATAENMLQEAMRLEEKKIEEAEAAAKEGDEGDGGVGNIEESDRMLSSEQQQIFHNLFSVYYESRKIDQAIHVLGILMTSGCADHAMLLSMARIAELKLDRRSAYDLADFCQYIDMYATNSISSDIKAEALEVDATNEKALLHYFFILVLHITLRPARIEYAGLLLKRWEHLFNLDAVRNVLLRTLYLDNQVNTRKAMAFKIIGKNDHAIKIIESVIASGKNSDAVVYTYSQCLSWAGDIDKALSVIFYALKNRESNILFDELLRLLSIIGDYTTADIIIKQADQKKVIISEMQRMKVFFGCRRVKDALRVYTEIPLKKTFFNYYKNRYYDIDKPDIYQDSILVLALYGPGDEIRFASMYDKIKDILPHHNITISCDPRLLEMMSRAFPNLSFTPVVRRQFHEITSYEDYSLVPGYDLINILDNNGIKAIECTDQVTLLTDLLHVALPDYDQFSGKSYFRAKPDLVEELRKRLPLGQPLVGLSWRSSLTLHIRNIHYLSIYELDKIFQINGIQYINFQYDECSKELAWVEERYPGKLIHFDTIDYYNDFESVAALMMCMDLIVSPFTTVGELSGALGCRTWLLSNSAEAHWRKTNPEGGDVWYRQTKHVEGSILGDKSTLVEQLYSDLIVFRQEKLNPIHLAPLEMVISE
jgi:capsular polysaccharide export protein